MPNSDPTEAEMYGRGLSFGSRWDFETRAGSIALVEGEDVLGRDLAFGTTLELGELLHERLTPDLAEEIKIAVKRVARRDGRIQRVVEPVEVRRTDDAGTAEVQLTVVAKTGERGEFVLPL